VSHFLTAGEVLLKRKRNSSALLGKTCRTGWQDSALRVYQGHFRMLCMSRELSGRTIFGLTLFASFKPMERVRTMTGKGKRTKWAKSSVQLTAPLQRNRLQIGGKDSSSERRLLVSQRRRSRGDRFTLATPRTISKTMSQTAY
jgi:hypothetical protein